MDPRVDRLVRRTTWACTAFVAWLAITADYGPQENVQTSIKHSLDGIKNWFWTPSEKELQEIERRKRFFAEIKDSKEH